MTATKRQSRPARIADEIEQNGRGWAVKRHRLFEDPSVRLIEATRGDEIVEMTFDRKEGTNGRVVDVLREGRASDDGGETWRYFVNIAGELRRMAEPPAVPFGLDDPDHEIIAAVLGRTVHWTNSISGIAQQATVPTSAKHVNIWNVVRSGERHLTFPDLAGEGFRTIRLTAIERVS